MYTCMYQIKKKLKKNKKVKQKKIKKNEKKSYPVATTRSLGAYTRYTR